VPITVVSAAVATPAKIGTTIAGTFSDATGHSGQSHLVFAPNAAVWWLFTLSSAHDRVGDRTVQSYVSSGADLATATWSAKDGEPDTRQRGRRDQLGARRRAGSLGVAVRSIAGVDYAHVFVVECVRRADIVERSLPGRRLARRRSPGARGTIRARPTAASSGRAR
jgi:hypothetical protein